MFKRIMAMLLSVVMIASMTTIVMADDPTTVKEAIIAYGEGKGLTGATLESWLTRSLDVPTDIEVKESGTSVWKDGPITITERTTGNIPTFDYKAVVDMPVVKDIFDDYVAGAMVAINTKGGANVSTLTDALEDIIVTGTFTITISVPAGLELPPSVASGSNMDGFNAEAKTIFHEVSRDVVGDADSGYTVTVEVGVGGTETDATSATKAELDEYLDTDLVLTCEGVQPTAFGTYQMVGNFEGNTVIGDDIATISYQSEPKGTVDGTNHNPDGTTTPNVAATIKVNKYESTGGSSGGASRDVTVNFMDGETIIKTVTERNAVELDLDTITPDAKEGYTFVGWYRDKELTQRASTPFKVTKDTNLYAKWQAFGGPVLQTEDHFAYIIGYTDGTVRPLNNIIREEVAAIFFRLLTEEAGEAMHEEIAPYSDVPSTKWSSTPIATLAKGGYITGRPDGTFAPEADITRAEFATIAARFSGDVETHETDFSDVDGHWAENYIKVCVANGWITGYTDGTFKPDQSITRAEAMAIVNRMLGRSVDAKGIEAVADDIYYFGDNPEGTWCYYIVLEATNSHDYERAEGETYETWTKVTEIRDWAAYEK